jgi:hypothetical protein
MSNLLEAMDFLGRNRIPCAFNEFFDKKETLCFRAMKTIRSGGKEGYLLAENFSEKRGTIFYR